MASTVSVAVDGASAERLVSLAAATRRPVFSAISHLLIVRVRTHRVGEPRCPLILHAANHPGGGWTRGRPSGYDRPSTWVARALCPCSGSVRAPHTMPP